MNYKKHALGDAKRVFFKLATARIVTFGREKLFYGEVHFFEHFTGVFAVVGGAFFGGNAKIIDGHQHLHVAYQLYNSENAKRNQNDFTIVGVTEIALIPFTNAGGNARATAVTEVIAIAFVHEFRA